MKYQITKDTTPSSDLAQSNAAIRELNTMFAQDVDIHTYTRRIGQIAAEFYIELDKKHKMTKVTQADFERTAQEIMDKTTPADKAKVNIILNSVRSYKGRKDTETGLDVMLLLVKTWELAKNSYYNNAQAVVIENLRHNKDTGGGCYPGIAARLVLPYARFLEDALAQSLKPEKTIADPDAFEFEQLQQILALSQAEYEAAQKAKAKVAVDADVQSDDDELARALALSLLDHAQKAAVLPQKGKAPMPAPLQQLQQYLQADDNMDDDDLMLAQAISASLVMYDQQPNNNNNNNNGPQDDSLEALRARLESVKNKLKKFD